MIPQLFVINFINLILFSLLKDKLKITNNNKAFSLIELSIIILIIGILVA